MLQHLLFKASAGNLQINRHKEIEFVNSKSGQIYEKKTLSVDFRASFAMEIQIGKYYENNAIFHIDHDYPGNCRENFFAKC